MKLITKMLLTAALIVMAVPLIFVGNAGAIKYNSDGAVQNATTGAWELPADLGNCADESGGDYPNLATINPAIPDYPTCTAQAKSATLAAETNKTACGNNGYKWAYGVPDGTAGGCGMNWVFAGSYTPSTNECLRCHNSVNKRVSEPSRKDKYLQTGHKNMLRKVTPGTPQLDSSGAPYGGNFDWVAGTYSGNPVVWIYDGWLASMASAKVKKTGGDSYSCGRCHATGWSSDSILQSTKEPETSFLGITNTSDPIAAAENKINLSGGVTGYTTETMSSWDRWGIQCSRCHSSTDTGTADSERPKWNPDITGATGTHHGPSGDLNNGAKVVRMCGECHRQETGGLPYTWVGTNNGTSWNKGYGDHAETVIGGLSHGHETPAVSHNYMNVFLNSPHAKFTGTYGQITTMANYDSKFMKAAPDGLGEAGCTGCHDVHESLAVEGHKPFNNECADCHSAATPDGFSPQVNIAAINHPSGPGTPLADMATHRSSPCEKCHMPEALHFFRINTDPDYESYTTKSPVNEGPSNTAADGTYTQAVWNDLDLACGQCHGGGTNSTANPPVSGAPYYTKAQLASLAVNIHNNTPTASFTATPDSSTPYKVNFSAAASVCPTGYTCDYDWDFGGLGTGTGIATSYEFGRPVGTVNVTLTVSAVGGGSGSITKSVTPSTVNQAPTCNSTVAATGYTATVTDSSTDPENSATLYVNWGDGSPVQAFALGAPAKTHTYTYKGTYSVRRYVRDTGGLVSDCGSFPVTVGSTVGSIGALIVDLDGPVAFNVSVYVKLGTSTKAFSSVAVSGDPRTFNLPIGSPAYDYGVWVYPPTGKKCYTSYTDADNNTPYVNGTTTVTLPATVNLICR